MKKLVRALWILAGLALLVWAFSHLSTGMVRVMELADAFVGSSGEVHTGTDATAAPAFELTDQDYDDVSEIPADAQE